MKDNFLDQVDCLVSEIEWKHKETYDDILKYIKTKVEYNKQQQKSLKDYIINTDK